MTTPPPRTSRSNQPQYPPDPINQAMIGRLAGVGRAAVLHWRRTHPDFPPPVGGQDPHPVFDLAAVRAWLIHHNKPIRWHGPPPDDVRIAP